jgi:hypothetical protein
MREPTLDDAIWALAAIEGRNPDELYVRDCLIDPDTRSYEARVVTYRSDPEVIAEAEALLRRFKLNAALYERINALMPTTQSESPSA